VSGVPDDASTGSRSGGTPRVSVIMPAFNAAGTIGETIESVFRQSMPDWEIIVVDDQSTDGTLERLAAIRDPRLRVFRVSHQGLPSVVRNFARAHARGDFVAFLDADDLWHARKLELQVGCLSMSQEVGLVHTSAHHLVDGRLAAQPVRNVGRGIMSPRSALGRLVGWNFIYTSSVMMRRSVLDGLGWFDPDPEIVGVEDFDLWLRACEAGCSIASLEEPLLVYRVRPDSLSRNVIADTTCTLRVLRRAVGRSPGDYEALRWPIRRRFHSLLLRRALFRIQNGLSGGVRDAFCSLGYRPQSLTSWAWLMLGIFGSRWTEIILRWRRIVLVRIGLRAARQDSESASDRLDDPMGE
jgi:glycosyltransferase involved in cell wall biosynthesis